MSAGSPIAPQAAPIIEAAVPGLRFTRHQEHVWIPEGQTEPADRLSAGADARGKWVPTGNETLQGWGSTPVQATGTLPDGRQFYFRFRGNTASLEAWPADRTVDSSCGLPVGEPEHVTTILGVTDDAFCGWFDTPEQAVDVFVRLYSALAPVDASENPSYAQRIRPIIDAMVEAMERNRNNEEAASNTPRLKPGA